jgi:hypothetical protein
LLRRITLAALAALGVLGIAGTAQASQPTPAIPEGGCAAFGRTQTYHSWGPAAFYERPVDVSYAIGDCTATLDGLTFTMSATGTASIADAGTGKTIAGKSFSVSGAWADPTDAGWPLDWWACDVESATLVWLIDGVFDFRVSAAGGSWTLDVTVPDADPVHFEYSGC